MPETEADDMPRMRFNHMELTVAEGALDDAMRSDLQSFYGDVLGWATMDIPLLGQSTFYMSPDDGQFILVAESPKPLSSPGYDHLGLLLESRADVDDVLAQCEKFQQHDDRMKIKRYDDLVTGPVTVHAFYVKYLLPIYFDVQAIDYQADSEPKQRWRYS
jgi:predicted enzyme related to lactoylglutathione lyase